MTESISPRPVPAPEVNYQPSMLSLPTVASTVLPEERATARIPPTPQRAARRKLWFFTALSALAGVLGASALSRSAPVSSHVHSGSPGFKKSPSGRTLHWEKKALTIYLDPSLSRLGPSANEAVIQAFGQWVGSDHRLPDLSFDTSPSSMTPRQDGKSTVSYGRITAAGHEHDVAITVSYANDATGEIIEADVILNALYPMGMLTAKTAQTKGTSSANHEHEPGNDGKPRGREEESLDCKNRYDAQNVTTHEAGHFFGLGEDPVEAAATMFQTIGECETHKRVLAASDVGALGTLYAASEDPEEAKAGARACSFGGAPPGGTALYAAGLLWGLSLLGRRRAR